MIVIVVSLKTTRSTRAINDNEGTADKRVGESRLTL